MYIEIDEEYVYVDSIGLALQVEEDRVFNQKQEFAQKLLCQEDIIDDEDYAPEHVALNVRSKKACGILKYDYNEWVSYKGQTYKVR